MKITVVGLGHLGTMAASGLAMAGHEVTGIDVADRTIERLRSVITVNDRQRLLPLDRLRARFPGAVAGLAGFPLCAGGANGESLTAAQVGPWSGQSTSRTRLEQVVNDMQGTSSASLFDTWRARGFSSLPACRQLLASPPV